MFLFFDLLRTQVGVARANRDALHWYCDCIFDHVRFDIGGATQSRAQHHIVIVDANLHLKICHFLLCAGAGRFPGVCNLLHDSFEFATCVRVDFHASLIAQLHVDDIVFVNIDHRLHMA